MNMTNRVTCIFLMVLFAGCADSQESTPPSQSTPQQSPQEESLQAVPDAERKIAAAKKMKGPSVTQGLTGVETLVALSLADEFKGMEGQELRARVLTFAPGAVVAVHQHEQRPGFAYILEGEIVEHRNDKDEPVIRRAGDVAIEWTGVSHWWENESDKEVKAIVVDILNPDH